MSPSSLATPHKGRLIILLPFWLATIAGVGLALLSAVQKFRYTFYFAEKIWGITLVVAGTVTLLITLLSAVYRARPACILFPNAFLFVVWSPVLACSFLIAPFTVDIFQLSAQGLLILTSGGQATYGFVLFRRARRSRAEAKTIDEHLAETKIVIGDSTSEGVGQGSELSSYGWSLSDRYSATLRYSSTLHYSSSVHNSSTGQTSSSVHYSSSLSDGWSNFEQPAPTYCEALGHEILRIDDVH